MYKKKLVPHINEYINSLVSCDENIIYIASGGESNQNKKTHKVS